MPYQRLTSPFHLAALLIVLLVAGTSIITNHSIASSSHTTTKKKTGIELQPKGDITAGKKLLNRCIICHGKDGSGNAKQNIPHIAGQQYQFMFQAARNYAKLNREYKGMRQAVVELEDSQLRNILTYYSSLSTPWKNQESKQTKGKQNKQLINAGKAISKPCQACHGMDGNSTIPALPSLAGLSPEYLYHSFADYFNNKRKDSMMEAFSLSTSALELEQLGAYYASLTRVKSLIQPKKVNKPKQAALCDGCHGIDGNSTNPNIPSLSGHNAAYLEKATLSYINGSRKNAIMKSAVKHLVQSDIKHLANHYAAQTPLGFKSKRSFGFDPMGEGKYLANSCDGCHGKQGNNSIPGIPNLAGQPLNYLSASIKAYKLNKRKSALMQPVIGHLSDLEIEKISLYYSNQKPTEVISKIKVKESETVSGCNGCHGEKGNSASAETPSLAGQDAKYLVDAMAAYAYGNRKHADMQNAVKPLNKKQYRKLATYYANQTRLQSKETVFESPENLAQKCDRCHGTDGYSKNPHFPRLAGQIKSYFITSMQKYKTKVRENTTMHAMAEVLSLTEIDAIASHYADK